MNGLTIIESDVIDTLIQKIEDMSLKIDRISQELIDLKNPYLNTKQVVSMLDKSENWVLLHKNELGVSKSTGSLLFKRKDIMDFIDEGYYRTPNK